MIKSQKPTACWIESKEEKKKKNFKTYQLRQQQELRKRYMYQLVFYATILIYNQEEVVGFFSMRGV